MIFEFKANMITVAAGLDGRLLEKASIVLVALSICY
jgi:hypothetical protein